MPRSPWLRLGGMHEERGRAGRGERRGELARDVARLADAGDDDAAAAVVAARRTASTNDAPRRAGQRVDRARLGGEHVAGERERARASTRRAERGGRGRVIVRSIDPGVARDSHAGDDYRRRATSTLRVRRRRTPARDHAPRPAPRRRAARGAVVVVVACRLVAPAADPGLPGRRHRGRAARARLGRRRRDDALRSPSSASCS